MTRDKKIYYETQEMREMEGPDRRGGVEEEEEGTKGQF